MPTAPTTTTLDFGLANSSASLDRLVRLRRRRDHDGVRAVAAREGLDRRDGVRVAVRTVVAAESTCELEVRLVDVQPDDAAALSLQQLDRDQPDEAEPDHGDALAEPHVGLPDALQRDGAEGDRGGCIIVDLIGDGRHQMLRDRDDLRVVRRAGTRNPVARSDALDVRFEDDPAELYPAP